MRVLSTSAIVLVALCGLLSTGLGSCTSMPYYEAMNVLGQDTKPLLLETTRALRDSLEESSAAAGSANDRFHVLGQSTGVIDSAVLSTYRDACKRLSRGLGDVRSDARKTEDMALATFNNWRKDVDKIGDAALRKKSQENLDRARAVHTELMASLRDVQSGLQNLSNAFDDQLLFAEHNSAGQVAAQAAQQQAKLSTQLDGCRKLVGTCRERTEELDRLLRE